MSNSHEKIMRYKRIIAGIMAVAMLGTTVTTSVPNELKQVISNQISAKAGDTYNVATIDLMNDSSNDAEDDHLAHHDYNKTSITMCAGDSTSLYVASLDSSGYELTDSNNNPVFFLGAHSFSSNNESVATVDENGRVTGVSKGTATITATYEDSITGTITVNIVDASTIYTIQTNADDSTIGKGNCRIVNFSTTDNALELVIPSTITKDDIEYKVTEIAQNNPDDSHLMAFYNTGFYKKITIPKGVTKIGDNAFQFSRTVEEIVLPNSLLTIGVAAFGECYSLKKINIPSNVTSIGNNAFEYCPVLEDVTIPASVTNIGDSLFYINTYDEDDNNVNTKYGGLGIKNLTIEGEDIKLDTDPEEPDIYLSPFNSATTINVSTITAYKYNSDGTESDIYKAAKQEYSTLLDGEEAVANRVVFIDLGSLRVSPKSITVEKGKTANLTASVKDCTITYKSNDETIATVSDLGVVTGVSNGKTTITVTSSDGKSKEVSVVVGEKCTVTFSNYDKNGKSETVDTLTGLTADEPELVTNGDYAVDGWYTDSDLKNPYDFSTSLTGNITLYPKWVEVSATSDYAITNNGDGTCTLGAYLGNSNIETVTVPKFVKDNGEILKVTEICETFRGRSYLTSVTLPDSIVTIGRSAFQYCYQLQSVNIPNKVETIDNCAFYDCSALKDLTFGNTIYNIQAEAFANCTSLTSVVLPDTVRIIYDDAFYNCYNLSNIYIGKSVETIGNEAFANTAIKSIEIPDTVKTIGNRAFAYLSNLESLEIPESVTSLGDAILKYSHVKNLTINCRNLTFETYYDTDIEGYRTRNPFSDLSSEYLETITAYKYESDDDSTLSTIYTSAQNIYGENLVDGDKAVDGKVVFINIASSAIKATPETIKVGIGKTSSITASSYKLTASDFEFESSDKTVATVSADGVVTGVDAGTCKITVSKKDQTDGETATVNVTVAKSYEVTFNTNYPDDTTDTTSTVDVLGGDTVSKPTDPTFSGYGINGWYTDAACTEGNEWDFDTSVTKDITLYANWVKAVDASTSGFYFDYNADGTCEIIGYYGSDTEVEIPKYVNNNGKVFKVASLGLSAFSENTKITSVKIPDTVTSIGNNAFYYCTSLTNVEFPDSLTTIGSNAFYNCYGLTSVIIPESVKTIEYSAFEYCSNLKNIIILSDAKVNKLSMGEGISESAFGCCGSEVYDGVIIYGYENAEEIVDATNTGHPGNMYSKITFVSLNDAIISPTTKTVYIGSVDTIGAVAYEKDNYPNKVDITYSLSSDSATDVIRLNSKTGKFRAVGYGRVTVVAKTEDGRTANITVTSTVRQTPEYTASNLYRYINESTWTDESTCTITAYNGEDKNIVLPDYYCNYSDTEAMEYNYQIKQLGDGTNSIKTGLESITIFDKTVTIADNAIPTDCTVYGYTGSTAETYAKANSLTFVPIDVAFTADKSILSVGNTTKVEATSGCTLPGTDGKFYYYSSDESVATVDEETGEVKAVSAGKVTITAEDDAGRTAELTITVPYTVTFDMQDHGTNTTQSVESGEKVTKPTTDPTASGYEFGGWYADDVFANAFDFDNTTITSDTTIYAKWTAHNWTYGLSGTDTITAYCSNTGCDLNTSATSPVTLKLSATEQTYTGSAIAKSSIFTLTGADTFNSDTGSTLSADSVAVYKADSTGAKTGDALTEIKDADSYVAELTVGENTISVSFEVKKADPTIDTAPTLVTSNSITYDGESHAVANTDSVSVTNGTVKYVAIDSDSDITKVADSEWSATAPTLKDVGTYKIYYKIVGDTGYNDSEVQELGTFTITAASQEAIDSASVTATSETIYGKEDGVISGVTTDYEYSTDDGKTYTACTGTTITGLSAGTVKIRKAAKTGYNASEAIDVTVDAGNKIQLSVPTDANYTITSDKTDGYSYDDDAVLTFKANAGYSITDPLKVTINGVEQEFKKDSEGNYTCTIEDVESADALTVSGVTSGCVDNTAPTVAVTVGESKWTEFLNTITFNKFFKETQKITVEATDEGSGIAATQYYISNEALTKDEVTALDEAKWIDYNESISLDPSNKYVVYFKIVDNANNTTYVSTDGMEIDIAAPTASGIADEAEYYDSVSFKVSDTSANIKVTVDGKEIEAVGGVYTITADDATHEVVITDGTGNETTYSITLTKSTTVFDNYKTDEKTVVEGSTLTTDSEASAKLIEDAKTAIDNLKYDEANTLMENKSAVDEIVDQLRADLDNQRAADAVTEKIEEIGTVTLESKAAIDEARKAYEALTEAEKKLVSEATLKTLTDAEAAYDALLNADEVTKKIKEIGTVTLESKEAIESAREAYEALTEAEKKLVSEATLKALTDAEAEYDALVKADEVTKKIEAIGTVTLDSKEAIESAREAYEALTDAEKENISLETLSKLKVAEAAYDALVNADEVTKKINSIGIVTLDSKETIESAREAYDALTEAEKKLVSEDTLAKLTDAENKYKDLAAAEEVTTKIDSIDTTEDTATLKSAVEEARKSYDALTDAQKKLISEETYAKLVNAEALLKTTEETTVATTVTESKETTEVVTTATESKETTEVATTVTEAEETTEVATTVTEAKETTEVATTATEVEETTEVATTATEAEETTEVTTKATEVVTTVATTETLIATTTTVTTKKEIAIDVTEINLTDSDTYQIEANEDGLTYTSSDPTIVTVDENGLVTAVANGETTIVAIDKDGNSKVIPVTVNIPEVTTTTEVTEVEETEAPTTTTTVKATTVTEAETTEKAATVATTATTKATEKVTTVATTEPKVETTSKATTVATTEPKTETTVKATTAATTEPKVETTAKATTVVTTESKAETTVAETTTKPVATTEATTKATEVEETTVATTEAPIATTTTATTKKEIAIDVTEINLTDSDTYQIEANEDGLTYTSSDPTIVTVDENGLVTAVANGETTIVAIDKDGNSKVIPVTVNIPEVTTTTEVTEVEETEAPTTTTTVKATTVTEAETTEKAATVATTATTKATEKVTTVATTESKAVETTAKATTEVTTKATEKATTVATTSTTKATTPTTTTAKVTTTEEVTTSVPETTTTEVTTEATTTTTTEPFLLGDVNKDQKVDAKDAVLVLQHYAKTLANKPSTIDIDRADVNKDGKVDAKDSVKILRYYASKIAKLFTGLMDDFK